MSELADHFKAPNIARALASYLTAAPSNWSVSHKLDLYASAKIAFASSSNLPQKENAFAQIYDSLSSGWQVFRTKRADECWSAAKIYEVLMMDCQSCSRDALSLRDLSDGESQKNIMACLNSLGRLKPTARYPAVYPWMAVSKFLHFFNPTLFPIYDTAFMWDRVANGVFRHDYQAFCRREGFNPKEDTARFNLQYTLWAAELIDDGDAECMDVFAQWFNDQVGRHSDPAEVRKDVSNYYATAFEMVAIGAAHLC